MEEMIREYINSAYFKEYMKISPDSKIEVEILGRGEYNINYMFIHPDSGKKLVLRINTESQMNIENQIEYEYNALLALEACGRTPKAYFADGSRKKIPYGVLVMEYLNGRQLDYNKDINKAAAIFADIHSLDIKNADFLIKPENPKMAMIDECINMAGIYLNSDSGKKEIKSKIEKLIDIGYSMAKDKGYCIKNPSIINTEVNSGNFIINDNIDECYLIDWEKPILGEPAQDIAHFLAPTTTYWKTDRILTLKEQEDFLDNYIKYVDKRIDTQYIKDRVSLYLTLNCLRGLTWCLMAWVLYTEGKKLIRNDDAFRKIEEYLSMDFIEMIEDRYFRRVK